MQLACEAVKSTSGEYAHGIVKKMKDLTTMYNALEREFKPKGSDAFLKAFRHFQDLQYTAFQDVGSYANEFKRAVKELHDLGCVLPQVFVNTQFIEGLKATYQHLLSASIRNNVIMPEVGQQAASLDETIGLALAFEHLQQIPKEEPAKVEAAPKTASSQSKPHSKIVGDERIIKIKYCTHCRNDGHAPRMSETAQETARCVQRSSKSQAAGGER